MLNNLLAMEKGLVFLSAPTDSGKTAFIKEIVNRKENAVIISSEQLADAIINKICDGNAPLLTEYAQHPCICVEDLDWYKGREQTQFEFAAVLSLWAETALVIATGVDLKNRLGNMFSKLDRYTYFEKVCADGNWQ